MTPPLFAIRNLQRHFRIHGGLLRREVAPIRAVDGVDLTIERGECLGLVGESGCGKTTTGRCLVRLDAPTAGEIRFFPSGNGDGGIDLSGLSERGLKRRGIRGRLQMVFQDPTQSLNPRMLVRNIIDEPLRAAGKLSGRDRAHRVRELLRLVGLTDDHLLRYPHEFSGGQRQRIAVARAIASEPAFIVLDEPTSALDVSVQAQVLHLFMDLQERLGLTYLFVTHHLLVVRYISRRTAVMYLGRIVETAPTEALFGRPFHPYTQALLSGIPDPDLDAPRRRIVLAGDVPSPAEPPAGCRFHTRCPVVLDRCRGEVPRLAEMGEGRRTACHRRVEMAEGRLP